MLFVTSCNSGFISCCYRDCHWSVWKPFSAWIQRLCWDLQTR